MSWYFAMWVGLLAGFVLALLLNRWERIAQPWSEWREYVTIIEEARRKRYEKKRARAERMMPK